MPKYIRYEKMASPSQIVTREIVTRESSGVPFQCPMLTSTNYTTWAIKMDAIMDAQGVWESIELLTGVEVDEKKNKTARAFIFQAIPEDILLQVAKKKTAKEVWESLKLRYLGADRVQKARLHTLKSDFDALRMKDGESIDDFAGKISGMISKFSSLGSTIDDGTLVRKLLDSVPDKYLQLVASIEQYSDVDSMPFDEAIGRLKAYEDRLRLRSATTNSENTLLLTKVDGHNMQRTSGGSSSNDKGRGTSHHDRGGRSGGRGRGNGRGRGGRGSSGGQRGAGNNYQRGRDKKHIKCFNCEEYGHYASECKAPKKNGEFNSNTERRTGFAAEYMWGEKSVHGVVE